MPNSNLKSQTLTRVAIIGGILILLNIVSVRLFGRLDLTKNSLYTLSDASKNLVKSLDDRLTVKAYFTEELPAPYNNIRRTVLDQLNEYKAYAKGNLQFEFIDPSGEKGEQEAQQQGIQPVQVQVINDDKMELKRGYMGMVLLYEDKKEVIPVIQNTSTLEYDLSSTMKRLTQKTQKKIAFLSGQGEATPMPSGLPPQMQQQMGASELRRVQEVLSKQYDVQTADVSNGQQISSDFAALIVVSPKQEFKEVAKYQIDQYIMRGGKVAFLLNKVDGDLQQRFGRTIELKLEDMLEHYGLRINPDLIRDGKCAPISIVQQQGGFQIQSQIQFPYIPIISDFSRDNMMTKNLQSLVLGFVSSVDTTALAAKGLHAEILARSSKQSGRQTQFFMFDPMQQWTRDQFTESGIPIAVVLTGKFSSFYANKPIPSDTGANASPIPGPTINQGLDTRIILVGDGDFVKDQFVRGSDNMTFFANIVDYLVDDAGLISIRSKDVSMAPLEQVSDGSKKMYKYGTMLLPPIAVMLFGLFRWRMRQAKRKALESATS
jgi:gliding-associated putative ABC transporter substrate-binding component GldG